MDVVRRWHLPLIALVAITACGPSPAGDANIAGSADGRFERVVLDEVEIWRSAEPSNDFLDAEVAGAFEYDEACGAHLHNAELELRYPIVWPAGTELTEADPTTVRLPDGSSATVGQAVSGGGGYHSDLSVFPADCAPSGETAVFNASGRVEVADVASSPEAGEASEAATAAFDRCADLEGSPPVPDGPLSGDPEVAAAQKYRAAMALPSDIATVEALIAQRPAEGWNRSLVDRGTCGEGTNVREQRRYRQLAAALREPCQSRQFPC